MRDIIETIQLWRTAPDGTELLNEAGIVVATKGRGTKDVWCEEVAYTFAPPPGWHINAGTEPDTEVDKVILRNTDTLCPKNAGELTWVLCAGVCNILWYHVQEPKLARIVGHRDLAVDAVHFSIEGGLDCTRRDERYDYERTSPEELRKMLGVES